MKFAYYLLSISTLLVSAFHFLSAQDKLILKDGLEVVGDFERIKNQKVHFRRSGGGGKLKVRLDKIRTVEFEAGQGHWFSEENPYIFAKPKIYGINYYILDQRVARKNFYTALDPYPETRSKILLGQTVRVVGYGLTSAFILTGVFVASFSDSFTLTGGKADNDPTIKTIGIIAGFSAVGLLAGGAVNLVGKGIMVNSTDNFNNSRLQTDGAPKFYFGMTTSGLGLGLSF